MKYLVQYLVHVDKVRSIRCVYRVYQLSSNILRVGSQQGCRAAHWLDACRAELYRLLARLEGSGLVDWGIHGIPQSDVPILAMSSSQILVSSSISWFCGAMTG